MAALFPIGKLGDFNMLQLVKLVNYNSTKDLLLWEAQAHPLNSNWRTPHLPQSLLHIVWWAHERKGIIWRTEALATKVVFWCILTNIYLNNVWRPILRTGKINFDSEVKPGLQGLRDPQTQCYANGDHRPQICCWRCCPGGREAANAAVIPANLGPISCPLVSLWNSVMLCLPSQSKGCGWREKVWDALHTGGRVSSPRTLGNASFPVFIVVQSLSGVPFFVTPWTAARQASLSFTVSWSLPKLMAVELLMLSSFSDAVSQFSRKLLIHDNWVGLRTKKTGMVRKILNTWHPLKCQNPLDTDVIQALKEMAVCCVLFIYLFIYLLLRFLFSQRHWSTVQLASRKKVTKKWRDRERWRGKTTIPESV